MVIQRAKRFTYHMINGINPDGSGTGKLPGAVLVVF